MYMGVVVGRLDLTFLGHPGRVGLHGNAYLLELVRGIFLRSS